jgi:hypothetical protein
MRVRAAGLRIILLLLVTGLAAAILTMRRRAAPLPSMPVRAPVEPVLAPAPPTWVAATSDGASPAGYAVKANTRSGIYHEPGGRFYQRTTPDRWYANGAAAEADGYRAPKRS